MKATGIIVEYNPFHNGHKYHLSEAKKLGDIVIAVMSGDFVQRGEPSIIDRWTKTEMALANGADLVIELPVFYSSQSAEIFAKGGIGILEELKCDNILFGSESNDINFLERIATYQESSEFREALQRKLKSGISYPNAHSSVMNEILGETVISSNDILGLEYLKAIKYWGSDIVPHLLKRKNTNYYDENVIEDFASATKIRYNIRNGLDFQSLVPKESFDLLKKYENFASLDKFYPYLRYEFIKNYKNLENIQDMEIGFYNRLHKNALTSQEYSHFFQNITNKRYTQGRTQRILLHSLIDLDKDITSIVKGEVPYVKILGFNGMGQKYLTYLKQFKNSKIITSYRNMNKVFDEKVCSLIEFNEKASEIYRLINPYPNRKNPIIKKGGFYAE